MSPETTSIDTATADKVRGHFIGWQCRIRQLAMRKDGGRPSDGMRPRLVLSAGQELSPGVVVVLIPEEPEESTEFFRFQLRKTNDPKLIYERGLQYLQATHFQNAKSFSDRMTAVFGAGSEVVQTMLSAGDCILEFAQFSQSYRMLCTVTEAGRRRPGLSGHLVAQPAVQPIPAERHPYSRLPAGLAFRERRSRTLRARLRQNFR